MSGMTERRRGDAESRADQLLRILQEIDAPLSKNTRVLDLGCGEGKLVAALRNLGVDAYGCDLRVRGEKNSDVRRWISAGIIRGITPHPYRLPFRDGEFDIVVSDQVFEHVEDWHRTVAEIARVTVPGGCTLHFIPMPFRFVEPHTFVPFAGVVKFYSWLLFWAVLGVRNEFQRGMSALDVARSNHHYLRRCTNYKSRGAIRSVFQRYFSVVTFREDLLLSLSMSSAGAVLGRFCRIVPWVSAMIGWGYETLLVAYRR